MKKFIFIAVALFTFTIASAQQFGVKAGFNSTSAVAEYEGVSADESISGFYVGVFTAFALSEMLDLQPEVQYISVSEDGESSGFLGIPILFKYRPAAGLFIQAGPQITYLLEESMDDFTNLGFDLALGAGYDITEQIFIDAKYALNLNNRYTGSMDGLSLKYNGIQVGLGYRFN